MAHDRRTFLRAIAAGSIGTAVLGGTATAAPTITIEGGGEDIWNQADEFHYYYEEIDGDFDVTVQVDSVEDTDEWARAGIMVRQTLNDDAEHAMVRKTPGNETSFQWRSNNGTAAKSTTSDEGEGESEISGGTMAADWLRLTRTGDTVSAYGSSDGSTWTLIADISPNQIDLAASAYVGLAVCSHDAGTLCTGTFSNLSGVGPSDNQDIGAVDVAGGVSTDDGGGDTGPVVSTGSASNVTDTSATLNGALDALGGASSADVYFEWRESGASAWTTTNKETLTTTDSFSQGVSGLSPGADYEFRALTDASDDDSDTGSINTFTASEDNGGGTSGGSYFDGSDGFASMGSWLDDSTQVITVTEPTRSAIESAFHASGSRVVVFETSGTIDLGGDTLQITEDNCWVAGQTAPSPGITFIKGMVQVDANNCVVQHIRSRVGPGPDGNIQGNDAISTQDETVNNVIDHCTASWGVDECMSVGYDTDQTTYSNNLIYEGLYDPYGDGSDHNYCTLIGDGADRVALLGNVWAKARSRIPRLKSNTRTVVANNLCYFFDEASSTDGSAETTWVGNKYTGVTATGESIVEGSGTVYGEDNSTADPPIDSDVPFVEEETTDSRPLWPNGLTAMPSTDVESHNLATAGARPADRTGNDERLIQEIIDRAGNDRLDSPYDYWIPDHNAVGGYPSLPENTHSLSVPSSGLRDWLEQWALSVEEASASPP
ncbi:DUF1349 domain-containing protein [Halocatena halophila]|uniref:DUF1349 domain-containing protein n=1 Tax=Halocatena halophila TaxID=2814576 RepID=UPI002ED1BB48